MSNINKIRTMTITAILAAASSVLMFFSVNVPLMPSFIKLDFSELPALFAAFTLGPISGVTVSLVKNLVNLLTSSTGGVGELSNFLLSCAFVLPAGIFYHKHKTKKVAFISALAGAVLMALLSVPFNFFIVYPIYFNFMPQEAILAMYHAINPLVGTNPSSENLYLALIMFNMPFTFIKGMLSVAITFMIYKPLSPIIQGKIK